MKADDFFKDQNYLRKVQEIEQQKATVEGILKSQEQSLVSQIAAQGLRVNNVEELLSQKINGSIAGALIKWLGDTDRHPQLREMVFRALANITDQIDGSFFASEYSKSTDENLKWVLANTIAEAPLSNIENWLEETVLNTPDSKSKEMLILACARRINLPRAVEIIRQKFESYPGHAAMALGEVGTSSDADFLGRQNHRGWVKKEIQKAIAQIRRRSAL